MYHYFDDITKFKHINSDNIIICKKQHENILIYDISYKTLIGGKPLRIRFDKIDGFIRVYDGSWCLLSFGLVKYDAIYNRIRSLTSQKNSITYVFSHYYAKSKIDSYYFLPM